ncbi:dicarboxylate/amino acid:cation symporter [Corynebacterium otitidis]|uniref:Excitatory amino acid transporter 1 n=1 Tax=Corynebacterium otitidis ATCC 51513 TaxID=883169 RepID=I7IXM9_9CORY|nr:dicarboxylate/amino acid:cation symporter [Corynebacterium otitidis]EJZ81241.1 hypothetical protein HMPREF9719_01819 [Corynebacterium otitidis ATCC 51513]CCI83938.1 Excitatory amino acid transporter 1 [Corynebacterium otitidis ATCC 51513]
MTFKKLASSLLFRVVVAIILGAACSTFFPEWLGRVFMTFNGIFGNFLNFFVPVLVFSLITPALASIGRGAGKWLGLTGGMAYFFSVLAGGLAYIVAVALYPVLLGGQSLAGGEDTDVSSGELEPYFTIDIEPPMTILAALLLAFCLGIAMTAVSSKTLRGAADELRDAVMKVIESFIIPLLPIFIFGTVLGIGMNGEMLEIIVNFATVLVTATVMTVLFVVAHYLLAGLVAGKNPFVLLKNILPAYATALGTASSAATIPVTYRCVRKNGVDKNVAGFSVPLCATISLSGSMIKIVLFAFAVIYLSGMDVSLGTAAAFILMLGITTVAAPGVPGGAIVAALGPLSDILGFNESQLALMIAAYIAIDSFGTAANVASSGAISTMVNRFAEGKITNEQVGDAAAGTEEPAAKATEDAPAGRADETDAEDFRTGEDPSPTGAKERGGSRTGR